MHSYSSNTDGNIAIGSIPEGTYTIKICRNKEIIGYSKILVVSPSNGIIYYSYLL